MCRCIYVHVHVHVMLLVCWCTCTCVVFVVDGPADAGVHTVGRRGEREVVYIHLHCMGSSKPQSSK